jgi:predicted metal-dependent peptidase
MALTAEQRIERCHIELMKHPHFVAYSGILMVGETKVDDNTLTACTNGKDVKFGRGFVGSLNDAELRGVILHESKHKMYRHLLTWKHLHKQDPMRANIACDYVINIEIIDEGKKTDNFVALPEGGLYDEKYRGLNSAEVFALLPTQPPQDGKGEGADGSGGKGFDEHDWEGAQSLNAEEQQALAKEIDQAIRQGAILAGKVGGNVDRSFTDLMSAKVDWKEALREFVSSVSSGKDDSTWRKPNRRWLQHDIYMPSTICESMGRVVVAIDTSGSIWGEVLNRFISEVASVMQNMNPEQVDLLYWDSQVAGHEVYGLNDADRMTSTTKPKGGGGTSPSCITRYMAKHKIDPVCAIILTDGYVGNDWGGTWSCPTLWTITSNIKSPIGQTIKIEV